MLGPELLRLWRASQGFGQKQAAALFGVSQASYWQWESGRKCPQVKTALRIARVTRSAVPVEAWSDDEEDLRIARRVLSVLMGAEDSRVPGTPEPPPSDPE